MGHEVWEMNIVCCWIHEGLNDQTPLARMAK